MTASSIRTDKQKLTNLIFKALQAYLFMRQIPGSPPYWQKFMYEVVAMVKQLGIPAWVMTLSCADLRWPVLRLFLNNGRYGKSSPLFCLLFLRKTMMLR